MNARDSSNQTRDLSVDDDGKLLVSSSASEALVANPSATFARPADTTAYASGDLVANTTVAGTVEPMTFTAAPQAAGAFSIIKARMRKSGTNVTNAAFRLHLFTAAPTVANGDNGVFLPNQAATWLGIIDFNSMLALSDGAVATGSPMVWTAISVKQAAGTDVDGLLEARGAYTPGSAESITIALEVLQD